MIISNLHSGSLRSLFIGGQGPYYYPGYMSTCLHVITKGKNAWNYLNFNVAKLINTKITVIIQNRTMTLGSGQPFNSK